MRLTIASATRSFAAISVVAIALFACASEPSRVAAAPAWTLETPAADGAHTYFVGYGEGASEAAATDAASSTLIAEILRYIGATITSDTTAVARATLDTFQADLVQTVRQTSTSRVAGFRVLERYFVERNDGVTVYLLGRYATADLEAEKRRIASIFQEKRDATAVPEAEGNELLSEGDVVGAARKFIQAAAAASTSDIENASIKFERNINSARNSLAKVAIEKLTDRLETTSGTPFAVPFKAVVKANGSPLSGVPVVVGYPARLANGRLTTRSVSLISANDGIVSFEHPVPDFIGKAALTMRLDLASEVEVLAGLRGAYAPMVAGLEDVIASKRVSFSYTVLSRAREVATAVLIADFDGSGVATSGATSSALLELLSKNGFNVFSAPMDIGEISEANEAAVLAGARKALSGKAQRLAYGTTRVVSVKDDSGKKIATVSAEIKVVELSSGRLLYSNMKQVPALGNSEDEAVDSARRTLGGRTIGEDLAANLP